MTQTKPDAHWAAQDPALADQYKEFVLTIDRLLRDDQGEDDQAPSKERTQRLQERATHAFQAYKAVVKQQILLERLIKDYRALGENKGEGESRTCEMIAQLCSMLLEDLQQDSGFSVQDPPFEN